MTAIQLACLCSVFVGDFEFTSESVSWLVDHGYLTTEGYQYAVTDKGKTAVFRALEAVKE